MWSTSEEPPGGTAEGGELPESVVHAKEKCEQNKNQLESLKEIMLKNKQSLKKKEEEVQEYARRLSKIKSRAKLSRRSKDESLLPCKDVSHTSGIGASTIEDTSEEAVEDISQAKTAKAKSTLLQKKLAENRKVFEQRNKEITETKRAVEEKVEAIRQQLEEKDVTATGFQKDHQLPVVIPVQPVMISTDIMSPTQIESIQEKENQIMVLNNRILELEATVVDLQENLKEKDSVIESKTRAVTLMSADLSKKGKTTLDTLEETKDEMRTMQEHFVLLESSLKNKNENLLAQLQGRDDRIAELEDLIKRLEEEQQQQQQQQSYQSGGNADVPRSTTLDTLLETKEVMKSMQENFILIESSLKAKNDHLLEQLNDYELKLAEANERILKLESGAGIIKDPTVDDLQYKLDKLERNNKQLQDEKYELQKNIAELQDKVLNLSVNGNNGALIEKDNRIVELENLIEELKQSNKLLEEESKAELQQKLADLSLKNEEYSNKVSDLESLVHELEEQKSDMAARLSDESALKEEDKVAKLSKELEELNKSMIKIKAQHRSKVKNLQKQLENVKKVSDTNAELVRLGNQVALLEEEKGNLQLSLVDFDELKASAGDWQERVVDLESKVSAQTKEIEMQIEAIATLENQKLDLMQELHAAKQEISSLEAENAESENLRVTAEMKVVDLEEELEAVHKLETSSTSTTTTTTTTTTEANQVAEQLLKQVEALSQENAELYNRIAKLEEKGTSESSSGSTESFEAIQELDKSDLLKKIEDLMHKNNELTVKVSRYQEEKENAHTVGSTEWTLETMNEREKNDESKKIEEQLTEENGDLTAMKLGRIEEKGSSDTGSTESFERIPEHSESAIKIELLTAENYELVVKCTKLEEQLDHWEYKYDKLYAERTGVVSNLLETHRENEQLEKEIESLTKERNELAAALRGRSEDRVSVSDVETVDSAERVVKRSVESEAADFETELTEEKEKQSRDATRDERIDELKKKIELLTAENYELVVKCTKLEEQLDHSEYKYDNLYAERNGVLGNIVKIAGENDQLEEKIESLTKERNELAAALRGKSEDRVSVSDVETVDSAERVVKRSVESEAADSETELTEEKEKQSRDRTRDEPIDELKKKIELLTAENYELVIKCTKREEQLDHWEYKYGNLYEEMDGVLGNIVKIAGENDQLKEKIESLTKEKNELAAGLQGKSEDRVSVSDVERIVKRSVDTETESMEEKGVYDARYETLDVRGIEELNARIEELLKDNERVLSKLSDVETYNQKLKEDLTEMTREKEKLQERINEISRDDSVKEKLLDSEKKSVVVVEGEEEIAQSDDALGQQTDRSMIVVASLEREIEECRKLIAEQTGLIEEMKIKLAKKEEELEEKGKQLVEYEASGKKAERLENELKEMFGTIEEWKYKCSEMQEKMEKLEAGKVSIEEGLKMLQNENQMLLEEKREKLAESDQLKQQLQDTVRMFESKVEEQLAVISEKEQEISNLRRSIEDKDEELHSRYTELQNKMITIDRLQDECNNCKMSIQEKNSALTTMSDEVANLGNVIKSKEEEIYSLRRHIEQLKERVEDSKPLKDYNELLEQLKKKDTVLDELDCRMNATTKEKSNLSEKVKSLSQQYNNIQSELSEKQKELVDTIATKEQLEALIGESRKERDKAEGQISELQSMIDNNGKLVENLKAELEDRFKEIEELKVKHTEDVELQNQRLKNLMEELNSRTEECERLRDELEEKEQQLVGPSMTEEAKVALEGKIADLEEKLKESEDKIHSQLEKMKKLAANLKKKAMVCQELESRVTELEEKWTTEKDEKEAKNKQIQDVEMAMREKDNRIAELEEKLIEAKNENVEALKNIDRLTSDLRNSKEKMTLVTQQLEEMEQEIGKLRADLESRGAELASERESRERIVSDYDSYRQRVLGENERKQVELEEAKEKARELSVRMQVMEAEYVEQLALIKNLQAESGLLLSKQAQINEKLENVEKESEERRLLIEQMQGTSTTESVTESSTQTTEEEEGAQRCGHCNQCQTLVQALEAKLEEREAEIENLKNHNELANSRVTVGNCVPMNTETGLAEITLRRDPYTELLSEFHTETSRHELVKAELAEALKENKELIEKMEEMTTTTTTEQSSKGSRAEEGEAALRELQQRLTSQASLLESAEESEKNLQKEIGSLKSEKERKEKLIEDLRSELEGYRNQSRELVEKKSIAKREAVASDSQQDNVPRLFDASKIFGSSFASDSDLLTTDSETKRLHALLEEKEAQCTNLTEEIGHLQRLMMEERSQMSQNYSQCMEELDVSRKQLTVALTNLERLEETLSERDEQIDALNGELENLNRNDSKGMQLEELRASLNSTREALDAIIVERDQHNALLESYKLQINHLEAELKNSSLTDSELIQELENRVSLMTKERDLLQLQVNDLSRSMEEMRYSTGLELEKVSEERDEAKEEVGNLTRALEDAYKRIETASVIVDPSSSKESSAPLLGEGESPATRKEAVVEETADASWDAEKLNVVDEEGWGWDADDAQLVGEQVAASLIPSTEMQLRAKLEDLEDRMKEMEKERERMLEESEAVQLRNGKMIKKLKEYKVQMERLQQQLKTQKSSSDFYGLDSAIEEELKCQIGKLEKSLSQLREELKNAVAEKEALAKRFDVVVSANERYMEMKERQDMDMEVLRIRNKELSDKVEALDRKLQSVPAEHGGDVVTGEEKRVLVAQEPLQKGSVDAVDYEQGLRKKYREEIDDLKEEMEALATENELLQHFLEEQKIKLSDLEKKRTLDENESIQIVDDLNNKISEMQAMLSKSREEYDSLRKQYEQSLMDANDQVTAMRQNTDFLKEEAREKIGKLEAEVADLRQQLESFESRNAELQRRLLDAVQEKASLEERLASSEKQLSSANSSMAEVTDLLNIRIQEVADLKQELQRQYVNHEEAKTKLQESVEELNQELGEKKQQVESLKQSLSEKEKDESVQQQSVETVSALVSQATQELVQKHAIEAEEKEKQVQSLQGKLNEYSFEKENILSRFATQQQELELLRQNLAERNSIFESVQANMTEKERELVSRKERIEALGADNQSLLETIGKLQQRLYEFESSSVNVNGLMSRVHSLEATLMEKESDLARFAEESNEYRALLEKDKVEIDALRNQLTEKTEQINWLSSELEATRKLLQESRQVLNEKSCLLEKCNRMLEEKEMESNRASGSTIVDGLPLFRMTDENQGLQQQSIDAMQIELEKKQEEIDHLKYVLNESTYPGIIREMQDTINCLYDEKAELLSSLDAINRKLEEKEKEIVALTERLNAEREEVGSTEQGRERASMQHDQEKIVRLQNELHAKEQEMNELRYVIAEKDSQLSLQASMEPQSDEFELRETVQRLTGELYGKEQEVQQLKLALGELRSELAALQQFQRLSEESRDAIEKLAAEKEQVRLEAQELLERTLGEKEAEIEAIKQRLSMENQRILEELQLRDRDVENLKKQMEESLVTETTTKYKLEEKEEELVRVGGDLAEKERRLAELSITKDAELHNFKVQIQEKEARIEELMVLSDQEEKQLKELKNVLEARETEINSLKKLLEDKAKELELIENVLKKDVSVVGASTTSERAEGSDEENKAFASQELDLALYMLHQRDVRCEELTHELMQLLEERDTLQLRLSNAIRVNEELRRTAEGGGGSGGPDVASRDEPSTSVLSEEPVLVEHPSPSKSEGPVEIAKEAIDAPIGEDKQALALKLSQLHTVSHAKDVRLRDERELRHTQQMSLLAHKDVLSTLPPEAAARLVNANYTLSRDVQSQSSVLLNWLWGKSTPKVVHM